MADNHLSALHEPVIRAEKDSDGSRRDVAVIGSAHHVTLLNVLMASAFLPEGLSLFVGDVRLPLVRILLLIFVFIAFRNAQAKARNHSLVWVPSDFFAIAAGAWIVMAGVIDDGVAIGLKGAGATALEFTGSYFVFRHLLGPVESSVKVMRFGCMVMIVVSCLALLDPLTGQLFTHDMVARVTGYFKPYNLGGESYYRNGLFRAMGPMEHSLLFSTACVWFGIIALSVLRPSSLGIGISGVYLIGIWFSQSRGPLAVFVVGVGLLTYNAVASRFNGRWKIVKALVVGWVIFVFIYSSSPVSTLVSFGGVDPEAGWYREVIWATAGPLALSSPMVGVGSLDYDWWRDNPALFGPSIDSLWLVYAVQSGIPCSVLIFLTVAGAGWLGQLDNATNLSFYERRLSVALGIVFSLAVFLGFIVHFWSTCWILLGIFPATRAHLAEAAITRTSP